MTGIQPQFWVERPRAAVDFYVAAFGARMLMLEGEGEDVVAQLGVDGAVFWVSNADPGRNRLDPKVAGGATGRTLLVVEDPDAVHVMAVAAGATSTSPVEDEYGWRVGRVVDPFGHEWEIGRHLGD